MSVNGGSPPLDKKHRHNRSFGSGRQVSINELQERGLSKALDIYYHHSASNSNSSNISPNQKQPTTTTSKSTTQPHHHHHSFTQSVSAMLGNILLLTVARRLPFFLTPEFIIGRFTFVVYLLVAVVYHSAVVTVPVATYLGFLALFSSSGGILRSGAAAAAAAAAAAPGFYSSSSSVSKPVVMTLKLPETVQKVVVNAISAVSGAAGGEGRVSSSSIWSSSSSSGGGGGLEWKLVLPSELWKITASGAAFLVVLYICEKLQVDRVKEKEEKAASRVSAAELQQTLLDGHFVLGGGEQRNSMDGGGGSMVKGRRVRKQDSSPIAQTMVTMSELKARVTELCTQLWPADQQPTLDSFNALVTTTAKLAAEVGLDFDVASATDPDKLAKMVYAVDNAVM